MAEALRAIKESLKSMAQAAADEGEEDAEREDEAAAAQALEDVDDFLNSDQIPGMDDHAELEFNPIINYKIKIAKEEARKEQRRAQLIAEGYDPDEMGDEHAMAAVGGGKQNALATLVAVGARVKPMAGAMNAEAVAREDRRRTLRTIDAYLAKTYEADVARVATQPKPGAAKKLSALDAAKISETKRAGADVDARFEGIINVVKHARTQLRDINTKRPLEVHQVTRSSGIDASDIKDIQAEMAALAAELEAGGDDDDDDLEAGEAENDDDGDEEDLEA